MAWPATLRVELDRDRPSLPCRVVLVPNFDFWFTQSWQIAVGKVARPQALTVDTPSEQAFVWGKGNLQKFAVCDILTKARFGSEAVVMIDTVVVLSIYSQSKEKSPGRNHTVKCLAINPAVSRQTQDQIKTEFQKSLPDLKAKQGLDYIQVARRLSNFLRREHSILKHGPSSLLEW